MKRVLVTGGAGFIGSHLVDALCQRGDQVVVLDKLTYAGRKEYVHPAATFVQGDVANRHLVRGVLGQYKPQVVVHAAAETHVTRSIEHAGDFLHTNTLGTFILLDELLAYWQKDNPMKLINVSTDEVYGSLARMAPPWTMRSPLQPNNPYAASKAAGELLVRAWQRTYGFPAIITHSSNNYGSRQHEEKLIPAVIRAAGKGDFISIHGDGGHVRDWLHVEDHVAGLLQVIDHGEPFHVYNFAGECERTVMEVVTLILRALNVRRRSFFLKFVDDRPGNDRRYAMEPTTQLDWKPGPEIESRIEAVIEYYLKEPQ